MHWALAQGRLVQDISSQSAGSFSYDYVDKPPNKCRPNNYVLVGGDIQYSKCTDVIMNLKGNGHEIRADEATRGGRVREKERKLSPRSFVLLPRRPRPCPGHCSGLRQVPRAAASTAFAPPGNQRGKLQQHASLWYPFPSVASTLTPALATLEGLSCCRPPLPIPLSSNARL